jgi:hypothetical protein
MLSNYFTSLVRTWVPLAVGAALAWLTTRFHVVLDASTSDAVVAFVSAACGAGYYAGARLLEHHVPALGWLLGHPAKPDYAALRTGGKHLAENVADDIIGDFTSPDPLEN